MSLREILPKQDTLLDSKFRIKTGVFSDYFNTFNLVDRKRRFLTRFINKNTLTEWQAIEILHDDIFLITAVFKMGIMNKTLCFIYDLNTHALTNYSSNSYFKNKSFVSPTLTHRGLSRRETTQTLVEIMNELDNDTLTLNGYTKSLHYSLNFERTNEPVVISVPMTKVHTVYTEKDLLVPNGKIVFKDQTYNLTDKHIAILDDHRGYYPLSSGYDWFTCMGTILMDGEKVKFGINLTAFYRNLDDSISENGYWLDETFHQLPNVTFIRKEAVWSIQDKEKNVQLTFTVHNDYHEAKNIGFKIDYTLAFGEVTGIIHGSDSKNIKVNQLFALGEKRVTKRPFKSPYQKKEQTH